MGLIKVVVPDAVEQRFRKRAMQHFGYAKGSLSKAAQAAFDQWADEVNELRAELKDELEALGDPLEAITGLLKHVKKSSVELQHEVGALLVEKHVRHRR